MRKSCHSEKKAAKTCFLMLPNFKTEQILKNNVIILIFLLKLKGFLNFFASVNAYGTLWNHF